MGLVRWSLQEQAVKVLLKQALPFASWKGMISFTLALEIHTQGQMKKSVKSSLRGLSWRKMCLKLGSCSKRHWWVVKWDSCQWKHVTAAMTIHSLLDGLFFHLDLMLPLISNQLGPCSAEHLLKCTWFVITVALWLKHRYHSALEAPL